MNPIGNLDWDWFLAHGIWIVVTIVVAAVVYWALRRWALRWITTLITKITPAGEDWSRAYRIISRVVLWTVIVVIAGALVLAILPGVGVDTSEAIEVLKAAGIAVVNWLRQHGAKIVIIIILAVVSQRIVRGLIPQIVSRSIDVKSRMRRADREELKKRSETLSHFLGGVATVIIWVMAIFMILPELNIQIAPLLAGAGIAGIAIGFGAQSLIRDVLSGLFIITENQYGKGDVVKVGGIAGLVETVNIRRTILRDLDGIVHVIPNGEITTSSNYTKEWSRVNLNVSVGYGEDLDRVIEVLNRIGQDMFQESDWHSLMITAPSVLRVDNFGDSGIDIKILGETKPLKQWEVTGELRRRIKRVFDEEGIEIPWPHTKLYLGDKVALDLLAKYGGELPVILDRTEAKEEEEDVPLSDRRGVPRKGPRGDRRRDSSRDLPE